MADITSIKHQGDKRAHIPSKEEAGMENSNEQVKRKNEAQYPVNPVLHRGQDPELFWLNKYDNDDREQSLEVDIRSLYRHEHVSPELLINNLYRLKDGHQNQLDMFSLFGNNLNMDELEKVADYYKYSDDWKNRLILGDSLLVMTSLLEREGMAGKIQTIYFDPPYGIKYGSNWQMRLNSREVKDGSDDYLTGEPEMIKAFRDTWELGIHSYLTYLRDRLIIARELLTESGSCFVQISDQNVHLVRNVMDEVFGSENFVSLIVYKTTSGQTSTYLSTQNDFIIFYARNKTCLKYKQLFSEKIDEKQIESEYPLIDDKGRRFQLSDLTSQSGGNSTTFPIVVDGEKYYPSGARGWRTNKKGIDRLIELNRLMVAGKTIRYKRYFADNPLTPYQNVWNDTGVGFGQEKNYVVQTNTKVIERCVLMTSDPGDLILDPTCGSGTTAYVSEQWGRRWITIDTSRIALNIAKTRMTTAIFPYFELYDKIGKDVRQGFIYKIVPNITLKCLATDEPAGGETLYDQAKEDKAKLRVAGPFTVETLQNFDPVSSSTLDSEGNVDESAEQFERRIFENLKSGGVKNGVKNENAIFKRIDRKTSAYLHAEGFYEDGRGKERKAYIHIGPKFGTVSKLAVNEAVKECRSVGDADWLIILGFSFEADISNQNVTTRAGGFEVTKARMHDDLMQDGLLKKDRKAASFVTIGEPDIKLNVAGKTVSVEIKGLDIYDPIKDEVKARSVADIAYWMVDDDYDSSNFIVKQIFFCGGDKDEFDKWKRGLSSLSKDSTRVSLR